MKNKTIKILAIDDSKDNLVVLEALLKEGFPDARYITADSGKMGFELCQTEIPDVILLDLVMPGMDSLEVCAKLKADESLRHIPVIMITENRERRIKALEAGADAFLSKPVDELELKAQITAMLRIKESEDNVRYEKLILEALVNQRTNELTEELTERKRAEKKLIQSLDKIIRNRQAIMNLKEDLKTEAGERKLVEENLQSERNLLRTLIDNIPDTIYILDSDGRKVIANKADVRNIGGKTEAEVLGKNDMELFTGEIGKRGHADNLSVIKTKTPIVDREEYFYDKNNMLRWLLTSKYPLYDVRGQVNGMFGIGHDITVRKKAEQDLIRARDKAEESDRLKTAFLHNISHEIRTPMNAIIGFSALLSEPGLDSASQQSFIETISQSSNDLLEIVSDIIEISNIEAGLLKCYKSNFNLNPLLNNLLNRFKPIAIERGIEFRCETVLTDQKDNVQTDSGKLVGILSNLLSNAFKFTSGGKIGFGYNLKNDNLEFYVSDTGIGVPADQYARIFERFYQVESSVSRQYEGTGLGLPISKAYIELLGGKIWLMSERGKGSVFYFTIPFIQTVMSSKSEAETVKIKKSVTTEKKTVLVAEDEENNYILLAKLLVSLNLNLIHATNGKEAVEICESDQHVDLVLMDIKMPVMDGYEATGIIKKLRPDLPVIAQTAFAFDSDREMAFSAGCIDYIPKPFKKESLISTIKKYL